MVRLVPLLVLVLLLLLPPKWSTLNTIEIIDSEEKKTAICLPPIIRTTEDALKAYTEYLSSLALFYTPTFSHADIPLFRERYQIPVDVRIRAPSPEEKACYYRPGELCSTSPPSSTCSDSQWMIT